MLSTDKQARKEQPIARGFLDYFPLAVAEVAHVSFVGNQQHNPGEELHWSRGKSDDHADCLARHLIERGTIDSDGVRHSAKVAWRALAMLQIEIENERRPSASACLPDQQPSHAAYQTPGSVRADGAADFEPVFPIGTPQYDDDSLLRRLGCPPHVAQQIVKGTSYTPDELAQWQTPYVYIAGPMRGYEQLNFPAFDKARAVMLELGFNVISPADIDRVAGDVDPAQAAYTCTQKDFAFRDFWSLYFIAKRNDPLTGIVLLPGWEKSVGASAEFFLSRWLGLKAYDWKGRTYGDPQGDFSLSNPPLRQGGK